MIRTLVPWATSAITLLAMWLIGQKKSIGWLVGLLNQVLWVALSLMFETYGLLVLTAALIYVYSKSMLSWRRDEAALVPAATVTPTDVAKEFHRQYERMAPSFGYETRAETARLWDHLPDDNRRIMEATASAVILKFFPDRMAIPFEPIERSL